MTTDQALAIILEEQIRTNLAKIARERERDALVAEVDRLRTVIDETASIMDDHEGPLPTCAAMARDKLRAALKVNS